MAPAKWTGVWDTSLTMTPLSSLVLVGEMLSLAPDLG